MTATLAIDHGQRMSGQQMQSIALALLHPSPTNPRKHFDQEEIKNLAANIEQQGLIEPIVVRPAEEGYEIVAGERRFRALTHLGRSYADCVVRDISDAELLDIQVSENLQREDLTPLDWAAAYKALVEQERRKQGAGEGATKAAMLIVASRIGKSPSVVYQTMQLTKLIPAVRTAVEERRMSKNHAIDCARLKPAEQMKYLEYFNGKAQTAGTPGVREMREWVERTVAPKAPKAPAPVQVDPAAVKRFVETGDPSPTTSVPDASEERPLKKTGAPDKHEATSGRSVPAQPIFPASKKHEERTRLIRQALEVVTKDDVMERSRYQTLDLIARALVTNLDVEDAETICDLLRWECPNGLKFEEQLMALYERHFAAQGASFIAAAAILSLQFLDIDELKQYLAPWLKERPAAGKKKSSAPRKVASKPAQKQKRLSRAESSRVLQKDMAAVRARLHRAPKAKDKKKAK